MDENSKNSRGQEKTVHTTTFVSGMENQSCTESGGWKTVGFVSPDGEPVPPEYLVTVSSIRNKCSVISLIQDQIQIDSGSRWEPFLPSSLLDKGNRAAQLLTLGHRSLITKASSRRMWMGATPISLSLNLRFEAINDASMEVVEACKELRKMSLPTDPSDDKGLNIKELLAAFGGGNIKEMGEALSNAPTLIPPGPSPATLEGVLSLRASGESGGGIGVNATEERLGGGDIIIIEIGRFLTFYNVVLRDVKETVQPMMSKTGDPISSTVNITFETYEMITTGELDKMYTKGVLSTGDRK